MPLSGLRSVVVAALACVLVCNFQALAQKDAALGTFTVDGKTIVLKHVIVVRYADPDDPSEHTLVIVGSDVPLAPADLKGTVMRGMAAAGRLHAVRIEWREGYDGITVIPFHPDLADSGEPTQGGASIDLQRYDEHRLEALFKSRMVGQEWQFNVRAAAAVVDGGTMERATTVPKPVEPGRPPLPPSDSVQRKRALARIGYEFTDDDFQRAIADGAPAAVDLFLELGMKATATADDGTPVIVSAAMFCGRDPVDARPVVIAQLLKAGANPNAADENRSTVLIWAASNCPADVITMLIKAGADVNAKARGGGTALVMAQALQRPEVVAVLKAAGAK